MSKGQGQEERDKMVGRRGKRREGREGGGGRGEGKRRERGRKEGEGYLPQVLI